MFKEDGDPAAEPVRCPHSPAAAAGSSPASPRRSACQSPAHRAFPSAGRPGTSAGCRCDAHPDTAARLRHSPAPTAALYCRKTQAQVPPGTEDGATAVVTRLSPARSAAGKRRSSGSQDLPSLRARLAARCGGAVLCDEKGAVKAACVVGYSQTGVTCKSQSDRIPRAGRGPQRS